MPIENINRLPTGMLDFYGLKNGGSYPQRVSPNVSPVIEYTLPYAYAKATALFTSSQIAPGVGSTTIAITATGPVDLTTGGQLLVPNDETWLLLEASVRWAFSAAAGQSGCMFWCYRSVAAATGFHIVPGRQQGFTDSAAVQRGGSNSWCGQIWVPAGAELRLGVNGVVLTANMDWDMGLRVARYKL